MNGTENLADCASRGIFPSELLECPRWLKLSSTDWPQQQREPTDKERETCLHVMTHQRMPLISIYRYSNFTWSQPGFSDSLAITMLAEASELPSCELLKAETYWPLFSQKEYLVKEIEILKENCVLHNSSPLLSLHPILDSSGVLRVSGRECIS